MFRKYYRSQTHALEEMKFLYMSACLAMLAVNVGALIERDHDTAQQIVDRVISEVKHVEKREVENERQNISNGNVGNVSPIRFTDSIQCFLFLFNLQLQWQNRQPTISELVMEIVMPVDRHKRTGSAKRFI